MTRSPRLTAACAALISAALLAGAAAAPGRAASSFTIRGAGFGHGIGMSQYGAYGFALHGWDYASILKHYYTGTDLGQTSPTQVVRVLLQTPKTAAFSGAERAGTMALDSTKSYRVTSSGDRVVLENAHGKRLATFAAPLSVTSSRPIQLQGLAGNGLRDGQYRGWLEFRPAPFGGILAVNAIGLEQYVAGVVSAESPASWPLAALEAQAVAARTYAITTSVNAAGGYDQFADTRSQMYRGVAAETPSTNQAVNGTSGQVVAYAGAPATTFFFSTSGGRTENIEDSWIGSAPRPWLRGVADPYDTTSPEHVWQPIRMSMSSASRRLRGLVRGRFRGIQVVQRGYSPRVVRAYVVGTRGRTAVTGPQLRSRFGLMDSWMFFTAISSKVTRPKAPAPAPQAGGVAPGTPTPVPSNGGGATAARVTLLTGTVMPASQGMKVRLERRAGKRWKLVRTAVAGRGGAYRIALPGAGAYRVVAAGAAGPVVQDR